MHPPIPVTYRTRKPSDMRRLETAVSTPRVTKGTPVMIHTTVTDNASTVLGQRPRAMPHGSNRRDYSQIAALTAHCLKIEREIVIALRRNQTDRVERLRSLLNVKLTTRFALTMVQDARFDRENNSSTTEPTS